MSGWSFDNESNDKKREFTKFPEGVTKIRLIDSEPMVRWTHWLVKDKRSVNCPGKGCPICEVRKQQKANKEPYTIGMSRRLSIQIINRNTGKLEIMEQGVTFFEELRELRAMLIEKGEDVYDYDISVRRRGTGQTDTSYRLDVDEKKPLSDTDLALVSDKIDLKEYFKAHEPEKILRILNGEEFDKVMYDNNEVEEQIVLE